MNRTGYFSGVLLGICTALLALFLLPGTARAAVTAQGECGNDLTWELDDNGTLAIDGSGEMTNYSSGSAPWYDYRGQIKNVIIGDGATNIGDYAFRACSNLESVTTPDGFISIGIYAFSGCSSLESVRIPDSVIYIGYGAFWECTSLTGVTIPDGVESIGDSTFYRCSSLTGVDIPDSVTSIGYGAFQGCSSLTGVVIPHGVEIIETYTFSECSSLESVTIPDSVTSIGGSAFEGCGSLTAVDIPDSVANIEGSAFANCGSLASVTIPDGVESIKNFTFNGCSGLTGVTIPDSVTSIGNYAFLGCSSLESVTIPDSVTSIGEAAFWDCSSLTVVTIPYGVESLSTTFLNCSSLTGVTIPDSVTSIGPQTFSGCSSLTGVDIPDSVTSIGQYAFHGCRSLESVVIPAALTSVGYYGFDGCDSLEYVFYGGSFNEWQTLRAASEDGNEPLWRVGNMYYDGTTPGIHTVTFNVNGGTLAGGTTQATDEYGRLSSLPTPTWDDTHIFTGWFTDEEGGRQITTGSVFIGDADVYAQWRATAGICGDDLTWVLDGGGTLTISGTGDMYDYQMYYNNAPWFDVREQIRRVVINSGATRIGRDAFWVCENMTSVSIPYGVTSIGANAFDSCNGLTTVYIPDSVTSIEDAAFLFCEGLVSVSNYGNITAIGRNVFSGCISLKYVTIPDSITSIGPSAFDGCHSLLSVTFGSNVRTIGDSAFHDCTSLWSLDITDSITFIDKFAFQGCTALTVVTVSDALESVDDYGFDACPNLASVFYAGSESEWAALESNSGINNEALFGDATVYFDGAAPLGSGLCGDGVVWILYGDGTFTLSYTGEGTGKMDDYSEYTPSAWVNLRRQIRKLIVGPGVTSIGSYTFYDYCEQLTEVTISEDVERVGEAAFRRANALTDVDYGGTVEQWVELKAVSGSNNDPLWNAPNIHCSDGDFDGDYGEEPGEEPEPGTTVTVSVTASPGQYGTVGGGGTYTAGQTVTVAATPVGGYRFRGWIDGNATVSRNSSYSFTAASDRALTAEFEQIDNSLGVEITTHIDSVRGSGQTAVVTFTVTRDWADGVHEQFSAGTSVTL